ncbi:leucine-rich repeat-containing protein (plasmid) [Granulicella tundricola MP5ACTX9]|uniref:Leucine-rich repeat-containing protein n=1 Tax=Granulicella tundricola (strain ATCC BAA-1859 / DSM 23138 / MP5ACTX9) TaxID=1198114 RepID=E8X6K6_GRATM|nr:leucine-rich repeat-containing protein [Granulicella tundricola MP5ACTX9]
MFVDPLEAARYTCHFRTALAPGSLLTRARGLPDIGWTASDPQALSLPLSGQLASHSQLKIWIEKIGKAADHLYGVSVANPDPTEGAEAFFAWREKILEAFEARLVVTSVAEEIRATFHAQRDILVVDGHDLTELPVELQILRQNLKVLSLSNNRLSKLPDEIALLEQLTELDVSDNLLTELPPQIGNLSNLEMLSVGHNRLSELPPSIGQLTALRELRVNDNKLRKLPAEIGQLTKLRRLHLQQNRLTELPLEFTCLEALAEWNAKPNRLPPSGSDGLKAGQNPWIHPPEEIVRKGPKAIREFLTAHPRNVAAVDSNSVYTVYVDDNYHREQEQWKRRILGTFADCDAAIALCKKFVDDFFANFPAAPMRGLRGKNAADLVGVYYRYGEDPWICGDDPNCLFDAWNYAEQRCEEIAKTTRDNPPAAYTVYSCNNRDGSGIVKIGEFEDCESAVTLCRKIVDDFLLTQNSETAEDLFTAYRRFGKYAEVTTRDQACSFVPWDYAEQRCHEIMAERER